MPAATLDALRLGAACYLLLTALATLCFGAWRPFLAFPARTVYSLLRLLLLLVTAKRVRMVPLAARRSHAKRIRRLQARRARPVSSSAVEAAQWEAADEPVELALLPLLPLLALAPVVAVSDDPFFVREPTSPTSWSLLDPGPRASAPGMPALVAAPKAAVEAANEESYPIFDLTEFDDEIPTLSYKFD